MENGNGNTQQLSRVSRIEEKLDRQAIDQTAISTTTGGMSFRSMLEVMEFAKLMAISDIAVPKHLRGNVGACLAVCIQAIEWRMSPYAVANKSYVVNDRISYESQLIHAVIEQRAPLMGRLRCSYTGKDGSRRCKVWATAKGETEPFEYESPMFETIQPKNSPLWKTKPDLQLFYNTSRDFARMFFPDVVLGVYAEDEIETSVVGSRQTVSMPRAIGEAPIAATPDAQAVPAPESHPAPAPEESQVAANEDGIDEIDKFTIVAWEAAEQINPDKKLFEQAMANWLKRCKRTLDQTTAQERQNTLDAIRTKAGFFAYLAQPTLASAGKEQR